MNQSKEFIALIANAAAAPGFKENAIGAWVAMIGLMISQWLGGWDTSLELLLALMITDYITGVLGAIKQKRLNSDAMFWGGVRKGVVVLVVGIAALMDEWTNTGAPLFRTAAIYYYVAREGLSVVENLGVIGINLPPRMVAFLEQLNEKQDKKEDKGQ